MPTFLDEMPPVSIPADYFENSLRAFCSWSCAALGCSETYFSDGCAHVVQRPDPRFENDPFGGSAFRMYTYGNGAVMSVAPELVEACSALAQERPDTLFSGANAEKIAALCRSAGEHLEMNAVYFLFQGETPVPSRPADFAYRVWERNELDDLYTRCPRESFHNAFAFNSAKDVLAITAERNGQIVAAAGCDDRIRGFWQVGVDTLPAFRKQGLSAYLTRRMAELCVARGEIVFYTTWAANLASFRTAIRSGFAPVNLEMCSVKNEG